VDAGQADARIQVGASGLLVVRSPQTGESVATIVR